MFLLPVEGLALTEPWDVGAVRLHTAASVESLLASRASHLLDHEIMGRIYRETAEEIARGTVAQVDAADIDAAIDLVTLATDILRVFQRGAMLETCGSAGKGERKGCTFPVIES